MVDATDVEREYDSLLGQMVGEVKEYVEEHKPFLRRYGIHPEAFQLPLRPIFLDRRQLHHLEVSLQLFWGALLAVFHRRFNGELGAIAPVLKLTDTVCRCMSMFSPERRVDQLFGRSDGFVWGDRIQFIEQNVTSGPGGVAATDALGRFFDDLPVIVELRKRLSLEPLSPIEPYGSYFAGDRFRGKTIGYIDAFNPDTGELFDEDGVWFMEELDKRGIELVTITGRQITRDHRGIYADGRQLHVIYRGVAAIGLWEWTETVLPFFEACRDGTAEMIMSLYEMVYFDKILLAYLSDDRLNGFLPDNERRALTELLPWTRILSDGTATRAGDIIDLPDWCRRHQDELVLKKGNGFRSEAVFVGSECTESQWHERVDAGRAEGNWVVQEMVRPPRTRLPYLVDGELVWEEVFGMACPFVAEGRITGVAGRTSVPRGSRVLVGAGVEDSQAGIRTTFVVG